MEKHGIVFLLIVLHKVSADVRAAPNDALCESQLESMKRQLAKMQEATQNTILLTEVEERNRTAPVDPVGQAHWPADKFAYIPPLVLYWHELGEWMRSIKLQWLVAAVSGLLGILCVVNGSASFQTILIWGFALIAAGSAKYEVELVWPDLNTGQVATVSVEVGVIAAFIIHQSFLGTKIVLGAGLGLYIATALNSLCETEYWPLTASLIWFSLWGFIGIIALTLAEKHVVAILAPLLGGFLCSSAIGYLIAFAFQASAPSNLPQWIEVRGDCWLDFASQLLGETSAAGIFKILRTPDFPISSFDFDRLGGRVLWLIFFIVGMKRQWRQAKESWQARQAAGATGLKEMLLGKERASPNGYGGSANP